MTRMRLKLATLLLFAMTTVAYAQEPKPVELQAKPGRLFIFPLGVEGAKDIQWTIGDPDIDADLFPYANDSAMFIGPTPLYKVVGDQNVIKAYPVTAVYTLGGKGQFKKFSIFVQGPVTPTPPPGPGPGPGPNPSDPYALATAPIPGPGFRVLMVVETEDASKLPATQRSIFTSLEVRGYLDSKCVAGPDGATKEWRIWDQHVDGLQNESVVWQNAMKLQRASLPWVTISDPANNRGWSGPLPKNVAEMMTLLKKYGG